MTEKEKLREALEQIASCNMPVDVHDAIWMNKIAKDVLADTEEKCPECEGIGYDASVMGGRYHAACLVCKGTGHLPPKEPEEKGNLRRYQPTIEIIDGSAHGVMEELFNGCWYKAVDVEAFLFKTKEQDDGTFTLAIPEQRAKKERCPECAGRGEIHTAEGELHAETAGQGRQFEGDKWEVCPFCNGTGSKGVSDG